MAGVAAAGTLVGAVLETAGYITQERILADFQRFFESAGLLLFVLGAVGAITSLTLFGSYRMPRYFLIGPILFFFLTGVTTTTPGVQWKLGGGQPRTPEGFVQTADQSSSKITQLAEKTLPSAEDPVSTKLRESGTIRVSFVFDVFTKLVSRVETTLIDLILQHENDRNLLFIARTRALEELYNPKNVDSQLMNMISSDLMIQCNDMFKAAQELASPTLGFRREMEIQRNLENPQRAVERRMHEETLRALKARREEYRELFIRGRQTTINPGQSTRDFLIRTQGESGSRTQEWLKSKGVDRVDDLGDVAMTCDDLWSLTNDAIHRNATKFVADWEQLYGAELPEDKKRFLCTEISRKIGRPTPDEDAQQCSLVEVASVFMLRKAIQKSATSQLVQRLHNDMQFLETVQPGKVVMLDVGEDEQDDYELIGGPHNFQTRRDGLNRWEGLFRKKGEEGVEWHPIGAMSQISGDKDTGYIDHQRYQTRELRQKMFTAALLFPYLQGLLLYFLSLAYPFLAIIVVLPGRAVSFLNFFLLWMWAKSWSVAFAMVLVLDQVLWNLFPTVDFGNDFRGGAKLSEQPLPAVLSEAFRIDPTFNAHNYYFFLSMALFAIVPLTAYAFLKGKDAVVSSFNENVGEQVEDAANRTGGAYGIWAMNNRMQGFAELDGMAILSQGSRGVGFDAHGRAQSSHFWGTMATLGQSVAQTASGGLVTSSVASLLDSPAKYVANRFAFLRAQLNSDIEYARTFDKRFGRWGTYQMMSDAAAAGMDGEGGFEINENIMDDWVSARANLFGMKVLAAADLGADLATGIGGLAARVPFAGAVVRGASMFPSLQQMNQWLSTQGRGMDDDALKKSFDEFLFGKGFQGGLDTVRKEAEKRFGLDPESIERLFDLTPQSEYGRQFGPIPPSPPVSDLRNYSTEEGAHPPGSKR